MLRDMIAGILVDEGQIVLIASDAREAMQRLSNHEVDLLITDITMPGGMDGFQLARTAKRMRPNLHVIYISGQYSPQARDAGPIFGPIIQKPIHFAALLEEIGRIVA